MPDRKLTLEDKVDQMMVNLAVVKTDVTWLKRIMVSAFILTGAAFGIDLSGVIA